MGRDSKYSGRELERSKTWQAVLYPDACNYSCDDVIKNIKQLSYRFAMILHNEDYYTCNDDVEESQVGLQKKAHFHVVFFWDNSYQLGYIAHKIGLPSNYLQVVKSRQGAIQYLIHKNNPEKHQYSISEILTNIEKIQTKYFSDDDCVMKASKILDFVTTYTGYLSVTDVAKWCVIENCWDEFRRGQHLFTAVINEHNSLIRGNVL